MTRLSVILAALTISLTPSARADGFVDEAVTKGVEGWKQLNPAEKVLVVMYPIEALFVRRDGKLAVAESERRYGRGNQASLFDGNGDAFRHTYWNALMARSIGAGMAKLFADAHEYRYDGTTLSRDMDLANNASGRRLQRENRWADAELLAERVQEAVDGGKVLRIRDGSLVPTDPTEQAHQIY